MTDATARCVAGCGYLVLRQEIKPCPLCGVLLCGECIRRHRAWGCGNADKVVQ